MSNMELEPKDDGKVLIAGIFLVILLLFFGVANADKLEKEHWVGTAQQIAKCSGLLRGRAFLLESPKIKQNSDRLYWIAVKFFIVAEYTEKDAIYAAKVEQTFFSNRIQTYSRDPDTLFLLARQYVQYCEETEIMLNDLKQ